MKTTKTLLFLDDIRWPIEAFQYTKNEIFWEKEWSIVRNYQQFVDWIIENGLPKLISFDHDLADEHYWAQNTNVFVEKQDMIVQNGWLNIVWKTIRIYQNSIAIL